jgi:hypothetical protein
MSENGEMLHSSEQRPRTPTEESKVYLDKWRRHANTVLLFNSGALTYASIIAASGGNTEEALVRGGLATLSL